MDANQAKVDACREKTEAYLETKEPTPAKTESESEHWKTNMGTGIYWMFRAQADWTLTHMSHKDTEQSTIEASITLDDITLTDSLIS
jgi:hypothetical protein